MVFIIGTRRSSRSAGNNLILRKGDGYRPVPDLTIFDPERVIDKATYTEPGKYSEGIKFVLVNGVAVGKDGQLQADVKPGQAVRAPIQ